MDKQIIIDNVDVSGCESFCNGICCKVGFGDDASCKLFSDCLYKQLKRKEEECERLKEENAEIRKYQYEQDFLQQQLDQLKAENEDLKEIIQRHDNDNNALLSEFEDDLVEYYRRHRECLIEIKEICGIGIVNGLSEEQYLSELRDWQEQILNKINEVLDESN